MLQILTYLFSWFLSYSGEAGGRGKEREFMDYWIINLELFGEREEITLNVYSVVLKQKPYKSSFISVEIEIREQQAWDSVEETLGFIP